MIGQLPLFDDLGLAAPPRTRGVRAQLHRLFFGDDIFISYSRSDAGRYAMALADRLSKAGYLCFLDQLGTDVNRNLPEPLKEKIRESTALVLIGTPGAATSRYVREEVEIFKEGRRRIIPINVGGALSDEDWPDLKGLSLIPETRRGVERGVPGEAAVDVLLKAAGYWRRQQWLRLSLFAGLWLLGLMLILATAFTAVRVNAAESLVAAARTEASLAGGAADVAREDAARERDAAATASRKEQAASTAAGLADAARAEAEGKADAARVRQASAEAGMRQAQTLERAARESADATKRSAEGTRATIMSRTPGAEAAAVALAAKTAGEELAAGGSLSEEVTSGLINSLVAAEAARPLRDVRGEVMYAQISPDGGLVFLATVEKPADGKMFGRGRWGLWDARTGEPLLGKSLRDFEVAHRWLDFTHGASFSRDGRWLAVVGQYYDISLFNTATGAPGDPIDYRVIEEARDKSKGPLGGGITHAALDDRGEHLAFVMLQTNVFDLDLRAGRARLVEHPLEMVTSLAFAPGGGLLLHGSAGVSNSPHAPAGSPHAAPPCARAQGSTPGSIRCVHDTRTRRSFPLNYEMAGVTAEGMVVAMKRRAKMIVPENTPGDDDEVYLFDPSSGEQIKTFSGFRGAISAATSTGGNVRAVTLGGGRPRVAGARAYPNYAVWRAQREPVVSVSFSADGRLGATTSDNGSVILWDAHTGTPLRTLKTGKELSVPHVTFSPDGARVASVIGNSAVVAWDARTGERCSPAGGAPDGKANPETVSPLELITAISFLPGGGRVATAHSGGSLTVWDAQTCERVKKFSFRDGKQVEGFSPDGRKALVIGRENEAYLLEIGGLGVGADPALGRYEDLPVAPLGLARAVAFTPRGVIGLFQGPSEALELWTLGQPTRRLENPVESIVGAAFSADGTRLAAVGLNGVVAVWDLRTGEKVISFASGVSSKVSNPVALSPDGTRLLVAAGKSARVYPTSRRAFFDVARRLSAN